ncbi:MAG: hypothetical protein WDM91_20035 [Rhizomicrobium sp.]
MVGVQTGPPHGYIGFFDERIERNQGIEVDASEITHSYIILIDSCAGNDKPPQIARFHRLKLPFLDRLHDAGERGLRARSQWCEFQFN